MHISFGRKSRLVTLGAGIAAAAAIALSASGPALADTADTGGTATLSVPKATVDAWARTNVLLLAGAPATSSFAAGQSSYTLNVTGGNGEVSNFTGILQLGGGKLVFLNDKTGRTVVVTGVQLNFFNGSIQGIMPGSTKEMALAFLSGDMSTSSNPGPPATETFSCDQVVLGATAAKALDTALNTTGFSRGMSLGGLTTTFDVTIT